MLREAQENSGGSAEERRLFAALAALIDSGDESDAGFDRHARALFAYQHAHNEPYRRFCTARGITPDRITHWSQIPAAPAAAFKAFDLTCTPPEHAARIFRSSGTTGRASSRHYLSAAALDLYDRSLRAGFARFVIPDGARLPIWALVPSPEAAPESSLSHMLGSLMAQDPDLDHRFFWGEHGPDIPALAWALTGVREPLVLFGTAFAWLLFFDGHAGRFALPDGTRVLETGGFKGRTREIPREELYALFTERLGVPPARCLAEYGMCELCSQFYDVLLQPSPAGGQEPRRKQGPPWIRTRILDPRTGEECPPGVPGVLCHYDLANLNSVLAVATEDLGVGAGGGFELLGRVSGAELRGCSLTAEEWHARA
ncbi:MAG TPA: long-chain fatty acid--CoA ligase [Armatimonadetes bacterium]|jgi:hypothetical protein|nr:long-chain fatty acid--CoA ligase [Armatimonadota bacterium]